MDWGTLATSVLQFAEGREAPTAASEYGLRRRVKFVGQGVVDFVHYHRPWEFRWATASVTITAGLGDLPANFLSFGKTGGVFLGAGLPQLGYMSLLQMNVLRTAVGATGQPYAYSIGAQEPTIGATVGLRKLFLYPKDSRTITILYEKKAPVLLDSALPEDVAALATNGSGLEEIPSAWHHIVIYEGVVYDLLKEKANAQSVTEQMGKYQSGLKSMIENERQGREATHNLLPYPGSRRG
jgi:hypothetical protein